MIYVFNKHSLKTCPEPSISEQGRLGLPYHRERKTQERHGHTANPQLLNIQKKDKIFLSHRTGASQRLPKEVEFK